MRSGKFAKLLGLLSILLWLSGCSYVKSLFPDKERDYQFRGEIPEIILPDDLKPQNQLARTPGLPVVPAVAAVPANSTAVTPSASRPAQSVVADNAAGSQKNTIVTAPAVQQVVTEDSPSQPQATDSNVVAPSTSSQSGVSSLQVDQPKAQAWRLVARALSRQKVEIVERNQDSGYFYVKYDPNAIKPEDNSFWDELTFMFGQDPSHEQEYRVSLLEINPQATEVTIQNNDGQTLSNLTATHLLKLITDGITMDLPGAPAENPAP
jgi:outer membrane protein assembly factor BamC